MMCSSLDRKPRLQTLFSGRNWADPPLSALGPNWCQTWCQDQAIFPVFSGLADFLALCRQQLAYFPVPWHGRGRRFDPDQVHHFQLLADTPLFSLVSFGVTRQTLPFPLKTPGAIPIRSTIFQLLADSPISSLVVSGFKMRRPLPLYGRGRWRSR